jgi:hypothetical protein
MTTPTTGGLGVVLAQLIQPFQPPGRRSVSVCVKIAFYVIADVMLAADAAVIWLNGAPPPWLII